MSANVDYAELGLEPYEMESARLLHEKHGNAIYRIATGGRSAVLKVFADQSQELSVYELLSRHGIPTLGVYGMSDNALLIEDLLDSEEWRLAEAADVDDREVGIAVANWYRQLHDVGYCLCTGGDEVSFLGREYDVLTKESIAELSRVLRLDGNPSLKLACEHIENMKEAVRSFPETLNYNDFHWTNLALSRMPTPLRAIVFDYHLVGIGPAYCDVRNVLGSLGTGAGEAFLSAYGKYDEGVAVFDRPLSVLYSLQVASTLPNMPHWASRLIAGLTDGEFEKGLRAAISRL